MTLSSLFFHFQYASSTLLAFISYSTHCASEKKMLGGGGREIHNNTSGCWQKGWLSIYLTLISLNLWTEHEQGRKEGRKEGRKQRPSIRTEIHPLTFLPFFPSLPSLCPFTSNPFSFSSLHHSFTLISIAPLLALNTSLSIAWEKKLISSRSLIFL